LGHKIVTWLASISSDDGQNLDALGLVADPQRAWHSRELLSFNVG
jgi:hypothetical protein